MHVNRSSLADRVKWNQAQLKASDESEGESCQAWPIIKHSQQTMNLACGQVEPSPSCITDPTRWHLQWMLTGEVVRRQLSWTTTVVISHGTNRIQILALCNRGLGRKLRCRCISNKIYRVPTDLLKVDLMQWVPKTTCKEAKSL